MFGPKTNQSRAAASADSASAHRVRQGGSWIGDARYVRAASSEHDLPSHCLGSGSSNLAGIFDRLSSCQGLAGADGETPRGLNVRPFLRCIACSSRECNACRSASFRLLRTGRRDHGRDDALPHRTRLLSPRPGTG